MAERWNDIKSQTEAYDLDELLSEHMAAIVRDCREQINKSKVQLNVGKAVLERLPIVIRFSVPQMWSIDAKERMQNAAKRAGLGVVALASEPQAVLANLIHNIDEDGKSLGCDLSKGDCALVIDLGGGTGDFVSNELKDELSAKSRLEAVFASSGSLCGSQRVNEYILTHIVETGAEVTKAGGLDAVLAQHNLSRSLWRKRTLAQIENAKLKYGKKKIHCGIVEGGTGAPRFYFDLKE